MSSKILPEATLAVGDRAHGFLVQRVEALAELAARAYLLVHERSGARLLHLHADDPENLFSISFATAPPDDTGLPHIMEHSVLAGSQKFQVRDPFFDMVKTSMATFINAMTGADRTYYPTSSNVKRDLFNLASVYVDAVFHPLLTSETFAREAHHLAPLDPDQPGGALTVSGIVYNEMKGAYSAPPTRLGRALRKGLLPDTIYANDSGGDPEAIPELSYERFLDFHRTYYHPCNSLIFIYGDIPTEEYLGFLEAPLADFGPAEPPPPIARQPRFSEPRSVRDRYPVGPEDAIENKTFLAIEWLTGDARDAREALMMAVLSNYLLGNAASPLRKSIVDAELGADLIYSGAGATGCHATFSLALKDSEGDRLERFCGLVDESLERIAASELPREEIETAFRKLAYRHLEIQERYPMRMMYSALQSWAYGGDPLERYAMREHLEACRKRYEDDPRVFNRLIRERLLENPHRLTAVVSPDRELQAKSDAALAERMAKVRSGLDAAQLEAIAEQARKLGAQKVSSDERAAQSLPTLSIDDLPSAPAHIPTQCEKLAGGAELLVNDVFSNGVNYLRLGFDLRGLPDELWPYLPHYTAALRKLGVEGADYEQTARLVAAATGELSTSTQLCRHGVDAGQPVWSLQLSFSALDEQMPPALDIARRLLFTLDPRDRERLRIVLKQGLTRLRTALIQNGRGTAVGHASAGLSLEGALRDRLGGLPQLELCRRLEQDFEAECEDLMQRIEAIGDFMLDSGRLTASFTGSDAALGQTRAALSDWLGQMRSSAPVRALSPMPEALGPRRVGLSCPSSVAYCAKVIPAPHLSSPDEPLLRVGAHLLTLDYMMPKVRLEGNAYGAAFQHDPLHQCVVMASWRDPHVARTLAIFEEVGQYVDGLEWSEREIHHAIMATAKDQLRPIRPASATYDALHRHLTGQSREVRAARFDGLRSATPESTKRALQELLAGSMDRGAVTVVAGRAQLEAENAEVPGGPLELVDVLGR
ncbi:MAG: insulinase family protein [Myxococcales bacterium]|nr:insulinase family protein [Myxococcales bacterium]